MSFNISFEQIGHSLTSLKISHGFDSSFTAFPTQSFRTLTSLNELDLSNNHLKSIGDTSFHFLQNLRTLELNDNMIERVSKGTFQVSIQAHTHSSFCFFFSLSVIAGDGGVIVTVTIVSFVCCLFCNLHIRFRFLTFLRQSDIHSKLESLALHFNSITKIEENSFVGLKVSETTEKLATKCFSLNTLAYENLMKSLMYCSELLFVLFAHCMFATKGALQNIRRANSLNISVVPFRDDASNRSHSNRSKLLNESIIFSVSFCNRN